MSSSADTVSNLQVFPTPEDIHACLLKDRRVFRQRLRGIEARKKQGIPFDQGLAKPNRAIAESQDLMQRRKDSLPEPQFPAELPISRRREEIAEAIQKHQVIVLCGETGSGTSTQLPKICLAPGAGRGGTHRPHPATAHRRPFPGVPGVPGAGYRARYGGGLQSALPRPGATVRGSWARCSASSIVPSSAI